MVYMVTFTIIIPPMLAYIAYVDPMGMKIYERHPLLKSFELLQKLCVCVKADGKTWTETPEGSLLESESSSP